MRVVLAITILLLLAAAVKMATGPTRHDLVHGDPNPPAYRPTPVDLTEPPLVKLGRLDNSYSILKGKLTLTNTNKYAVADTVINCDVTASSGTTVGGYNFTIYEVLQPSKPKTVDYNFGFWPQQGKSLNCRSLRATRR
jgi:hypothetical protein